MESLSDWPRQRHAPGGKNPFLFFVVYGRIDLTRDFSRIKYRTNGIPDGIDVMIYGPTEHRDTVEAFREGDLWDQLAVENPSLAAEVAQQDSCLIIRGEIVDPPTLNYFRDVVGFLTYCLDAGGVGIYDPQMLRWWSAPQWRSHVFEVRGPAPRQHVVILISDDSAGTEWIHTRGMRKFGRPDISIRNVEQRHKAAIVDLCNRFIELLASGAVVADGEEIQMNSLPSGMKCFCRGTEEDPDFNNEHLEIVWPYAP